MRLMELKMGLVAAGAALLAAHPAGAVVVTGALTGGSALANGGQFLIITPVAPFTVGGDNIGDNNVRVFNERQGVTLLSNLTVRDGVIASGTRVNSHYFFFDPAVSRRAIGTVTFSTRILGVATTRALLSASDFLGLPQVTYSYATAAGLEPADVATFAGKTLSFNVQAASPSDSIRILTAVPEPAAWAMLIAGFGLVGAAARRRRGVAPVVSA